MQGAGPLTALAALLLAPLQWRQARAQRLRLLSSHELNLRRASQPLGVVAVVLWFVWIIGARDFGNALAPMFLNPSDNWLIAALSGALLLYGVVSFVVGASGCLGVRSDGLLPFWAFVRLAAGGGALMLLRPDLGEPPGDDLGAALLWLALNSAAIWCAAIGAARLLLLVLGGGSALRTVTRQVNQKNAPLRPARRRWWQWW